MALPSQSSEPSTAQHRELSYWRDLAVDSLLELAAARQRLALVDEDLVELVGHERHKWYGTLGGTQLTVGAFRAKVRHELLTGEHI